MSLEDRLRKQWTESAADWIGQDQAVRTGMLDSWILNALRKAGAGDAHPLTAA